MSTESILNNTPILVGVGQVVSRDPADLKTAPGPMDMMVDAVGKACADAGPGESIANAADSLRVVNFLAGNYQAPVDLLAERLGVMPADRVYSDTGGNSPQQLVNRTAEDLAEGRITLAILAGVEALGAMVKALQQGIIPDWIERDGAQPGTSSPDYEGTADYEVPYGLQLPVNVYPLFENALRAHYGRSIEEHQRALGELMAPFSRVASTNPIAWFPREYSPEEIATETPENRMIGFPYTKRMNAIIRVDQAASLVMTTVGQARELGIDEAKWIYLHGCSEGKDHWFVTERESLHASPAAEVCGREALDMAGIAIVDVQHLDLYSCFPSAVQMARDALGIAANDARDLTVTGGLPYHGGPSNNYVMHSIAAMAERLRGDRGAFGLCTAIGWFATKHAMGVYSTKPYAGTWSRKAPETYQREIDARPKAEMALEPSGDGTVETYTVLHGREGAERGIVVGRLDDGRRFLAATDDPAVWARMMEKEFVGVRGTVETAKPCNRFVPLEN